MFIEIRVYDNGKAMAKMYEEKPKSIYDKRATFDQYIEEFNHIEAFLADIDSGVDYEDLVKIQLRLQSGNWVNITPYI